jgi:hypothetical protein
VAAPYGLLDRHMIETAEQVGYQGVCNSRRGSRSRTIA